MNINYFDESSNPFSHQTETLDTDFEPCSGYFRDKQAVSTATRSLIDLLGIEERHKVLDVGFGSNTSVAKTLIEYGCEVYGLDAHLLPVGTKRIEIPAPPKFIQSYDGFHEFGGWIEDIKHRDSELKKIKFDTIVFWGSWYSGGNNYTVAGEMGEMRLRKERPELFLQIGDVRFAGDFSKSDPVEIAKEKRNWHVINMARQALNHRGQLLVVSSRYAFHGSGFRQEDLPLEKRLLYRFISKVMADNNPHIYLFGISKEKTYESLDKEIARRLCRHTELFRDREQLEAPYSQRFVSATSELSSSLGRIDAVNIRF